MTTGLWFWVFIEIWPRNISNFVPQKPILRDFKTYLKERNEPKQSINTAWQNQSVKLCRTKGQNTENWTANVWMSQTVFTDFYTQYHAFLFFSASSLIPIAIAGTPILFNCSPWYFIVASRTRQAIMIMKTAPASLFIRDNTRGKSWKVTLFQKPVGRIPKFSPIDHIFMQSFCSSHFTSENLLACCLKQIWMLCQSLKGLWSLPYCISHLHQ